MIEQAAVVCSYFAVLTTSYYLAALDRSKEYVPHARLPACDSVIYRRSTTIVATGHQLLCQWPCKWHRQLMANGQTSSPHPRRPVPTPPGRHQLGQEYACLPTCNNGLRRTNPVLATNNVPRGVPTWSSSHWELSLLWARRFAPAGQFIVALFTSVISNRKSSKLPSRKKYLLTTAVLNRRWRGKWLMCILQYKLHCYTHRLSTMSDSTNDWTSRTVSSRACQYDIHPSPLNRNIFLHFLGFMP